MRNMIKPQPELSEEELLQRAGRGDARAFERLQELIAPRLFGLLRQMLHDEREAVEMLQNGFVQLWERASAFDPERSQAFTWAVTIFRNQAIERMRALGRRNRLIESDALRQVSLLAQAPTDDGDERSGRVRQALSALPKEQSHLIECAFLKGLTHHVIAESLGLPLEKVKTGIRSGMLRLHELLKGAA